MMSSRSLALDPNNNRHLSYSIREGELKYASSSDGTNWGIAVRQEQLVLSGCFTTLSRMGGLSIGTGQV